jgi:hypothetical protein
MINSYISQRGNKYIDEEQLFDTEEEVGEIKQW